MFFRGVLQRWREQPSGGDDTCVADACGSANARLAELAADPEDFADLAAVLKVGLYAVVAMLASTDGPHTTDDLVAAPVAESRREATTLGGGRGVGWGRWTRVRGGARVHPETVEREPTRTVRPAMAAS